MKTIKAQVIESCSNNYSSTVNSTLKLPDKKLLMLL